jgi:hypothetical protein
MRNTIAFIVLMFFATLAFAKGDEMVDVEMANVGLSNVDVTLNATADHHFIVADKSLDAGQLKAFFTEQAKRRPLKYVLVSGEEMTIGDLVAVAHVGEAMHFTVLFESKGKLKSLKLVK